MKRIIAPSILSLDFTKFPQQMEELNQSKAEWIHFDVMDGHFVPNLSFGPDILKAVRKSTDKVIDVHLMIDNPRNFISVFAKAGADVITIHTESFNNQVEEIKSCLDYIHSFDIQAGFVLKPGTQIEPFEELLPYTDIVLIMSVEPGFGGQSFQEQVLYKPEYLDSLRKQKGLNYRIEIDGGIDDVTVKKAVESGVDTIVAGSYIFKNDIKETVERLLK